MNLAYASASASACLKRSVGAVVVRPGGERQMAIDNTMQTIRRSDQIVSTGYNENPDWMQPCYNRYEACFRDLWMEEQLLQIAPRRCPSCGAAIAPIQDDDGSRRYPLMCLAEGCKASLKRMFFPGRAMTHCTAVHAEQRAIRSSGLTSLEGCHLYSTTFPCFLCAEEIIQANIAKVVYVEPYPDSRAEELLRDHGVVIERFSGVKSRAFLRFFGGWRADAERKYAYPRIPDPNK